MKKTVLTGLATVLLVALAACGGSDGDEKKDSGTEQPSEAAVVKAFTTEFASNTTGALDEEEAGCFAEDFVGSAGVDRLEEAKLIDAKGAVTQETAVFDEKLATEFAQAFLGCVDYTAKQAAVLAESDKKVDEKKLAACLDEALPNDFVLRFIVSSYLESKDVETLRKQSAARVEKCVNTSKK